MGRWLRNVDRCCTCAYRLSLPIDKQRAPAPTNAQCIPHLGKVDIFLQRSSCRRTLHVYGVSHTNPRPARPSLNKGRVLLVMSMPTHGAEIRGGAKVVVTLAVADTDPGNASFVDHAVGERCVDMAVDVLERPPFSPSSGESHVFTGGLKSKTN